MAIVNLKDVKVYATFSKGFRVIEESSKGAKTYSQRWTVWSDGLGVAEGDIISLSGFLSAKVSEWTDKDQQVRHSVELSLNSPRLATGDDKPTTDTAPVDEPWAASTPGADVWNTPGSQSDETPF